MYKVLVVDDSKHSREGAAAKIRSLFSERCEVQTACDGLSALSLSLSWQPDILLTDLRMPFMDGIELAEKLRVLVPSLKIVFFSNYSDKEYLKAAIKIQAVSYIDKPVDDEKLYSTIESCVVSLDESRLLRRELLSYREDFRALIMRLWGNALCRPNIYIDSYTRHFEKLHLEKLVQAAYRCIICPYQPDSELFGRLSEGVYRYLPAMDIDRQAVGFVYADDEALLNGSGFYSLMDRLSSACERMRISVGDNAPDYARAWQSYQTALEASEEHFFDDNPVHFHAPQAKGAKELPDIDALLAALKQNAMSTNPPLEAAINAAMDALALTRSEEAARLFCIRLADFLIKYSEAYYFDFHLCFSRQQLLNAIGAARLYGDLRALINGWAANLRGETTGEKAIVRMVVSYVNLHYAEPLSVADIASHIGYSTAHLSELFKQHTGVTIKQQIINVRIDHVKRALKQGGYSLESIAAACGYQNARYLCHVFKSHTGVTPSQYRGDC